MRPDQTIVESKATAPSAGQAEHDGRVVLNESQARRIVSTFSHIDGLLSAVERAVATSTTRRSDLAREYVDLTETERRLVASLVLTARRRMLASIDYLGLPRPAADVSARWSAITTFRFIDISLSELNPGTLRGYGAVDERAAAEVVAVATELRELIARGREVLQPRVGERLRERLVDVPGPLGEFLRGAEEVSTRHALVEARPLIAAAAERASTSTIDVGVFGRVSSGKSSLINALAGFPILPVGATPVTAVPLRVVHGTEAIEVRFANGHRESVDNARLADYATEAGNADNRRDVDSILIQTPHLPEGLALLDTPGVGSLSQSGPAQAFAWLPRCDLGIVLVAAGTPLGRDEIALIAGLTASGIEVEVLLSKIDLIPADQRDVSLAYVGGEIERAIGSRLTVRPLSVMSTDAALLERWRSERLMPLVAARRVVAESARARRVRALLATLNAALSERTVVGGSHLDVHRVHSRAESEIAAAAVELESAGNSAIDHAADAIAAAWRDGSDARNAARSALLEPPNHALRRVREAADSVLTAAGIGSTDETATRIPPLFDPPLLDADAVPEKPSAVDRIAGRTRAYGRLAGTRAPIHDAYGTYANRIRAWGHERLEENTKRVIAATPVEMGDLAAELQPLARIAAEHFADPAAAAR